MLAKTNCGVVRGDVSTPEAQNTRSMNTPPMYMRPLASKEAVGLAGPVT